MQSFHCPLPMEHRGQCYFLDVNVWQYKWKFLLGLDYILPMWLTLFVSLSRGSTGISWSKALFINYIIRLSTGQCPQANKDVPVRQDIPRAKRSPLSSQEQRPGLFLGKVNSSLHREASLNFLNYFNFQFCKLQVWIIIWNALTYWVLTKWWLVLRLLCTLYYSVMGYIIQSCEVDTELCMR